MDDGSKSNPYQPRKARRAPPDDEARRRPVGLLIAAVLEAWTMVYTAFTAPGTLQQFREMLGAFGSDLPAATKLVLDAPVGISWIFAAASIAQFVWIIRRPEPSDVERRRMKMSLWILGAVFGATIGWALYGLYSALFKLGSVV